MRVWPGVPHPLGPPGMARGQFALFSENATGVQLCLFDEPTVAEPTATITMRSGRTTSGMCTFPTFDPVRCTATGRRAV